MITRSGSHGRPQVGDGGLIVGAVDVGFGERRAEPAVMIDDDEASRAPVIIEGPSRIRTPAWMMIIGTKVMSTRFP